jgi:hypothetical protein
VEEFPELIGENVREKSSATNVLKGIGTAIQKIDLTSMPLLPFLNSYLKPSSGSKGF